MFCRSDKHTGEKDLINRDVDQYCRRCDVCQRVNAKVEGKKAELHPIPVPSKVRSQIGIDLIGIFNKLTKKKIL